MPHNEKQYYTYLLASKKHGTLYTGMSSDLIKRIYQHKNKITKGFVAKYNVTRLVYFEVHDSALAAITREKQIKEWQREWKINLIEKMNPEWHDLYDGLI